MFLIEHALATACCLGALAIAHGVELEHQAVHRRGFPKRNALNDAVGFILGAPLFVSLSEYRSNHLHHHKALGTADDFEQFDYNTASPMTLFASVFLLGNLRQFFLSLVRPNSGKPMSETDRRRTRKEKVGILFLHVSGVFALHAFYGASGLVYYGTSVALASALHFLIELPEHYRCDRTSRSPFVNTRTISSNLFMFWLTNGNNFHVEHHYRAALTPEQCRALHQALKRNIVQLDSGYWAFYCSVFEHAFSPLSADATRTEAD